MASGGEEQSFSPVKGNLWRQNSMTSESNMTEGGEERWRQRYFLAFELIDGSSLFLLITNLEIYWIWFLVVLRCCGVPCVRSQCRRTSLGKRRLGLRVPSGPAEYGVSSWVFGTCPWWRGLTTLMKPSILRDVNWWCQLFSRCTVLTGLHSGYLLATDTIVEIRMTSVFSGKRMSSTRRWVSPFGEPSADLGTRQQQWACHSLGLSVLEFGTRALRGRRVVGFRV